MPSSAYCHCVLCMILSDLTPTLDVGDVQQVPTTPVA